MSRLALVQKPKTKMATRRRLDTIWYLLYIDHGDGSATILDYGRDYAGQTGSDETATEGFMTVEVTDGTQIVTDLIIGLKPIDGWSDALINPRRLKVTNPKPLPAYKMESEIK